MGPAGSQSVQSAKKVKKVSTIRHAQLDSELLTSQLSDCLESRTIQKGSKNSTRISPHLP